MSIADGRATFVGQINGGSINIGNGSFVVNDQGNVTITRGSINLGGTAAQPNFQVTSTGQVTIRQGSISIGGTAAQPRFHVDTSGNVTLRWADIQGGRFRIGNTEVSESFFRTSSGQNCNFSWSTMDSTCLYHGVLNANQINAGFISADRIQVGSLSANVIGTGLLQAERIEAGQALIDRLGVNQLSAISANIGNITAGSLWGVNLSWEGTPGNPLGRLSWTPGQDVSGPTTLIHMESQRGVRISANNGGIALHATNGVWLGGDDSGRVATREWVAANFVRR